MRLKNVLLVVNDMERSIRFYKELFRLQVILDQVIYVYCRSGNRSKQASEKLAAMGYTNIVEFGGILDWTGEVERHDR